MRLRFEGGPWDNQLLDSAVSTAPARVAPDSDDLGVYLRSDQPSGSTVVVYQWLPVGAEAARRTTLASRLAHGAVLTKSRGTPSGRGERVGGIGRVRARIGLEVVGAVSALALAIVTLLSPDWIEVVLRVDPDHGSGALEWAVVIALSAISIGLTLAGRQQWRQLKATA